MTFHPGLCWGVGLTPLLEAGALHMGWQRLPPFRAINPGPSLSVTPLGMHQLLQGSQQLWARTTTCCLGTLR